MTDKASRYAGNGVEAVGQVDYTRRIDGGPIDHGFQSFFGTACCPTTDWLYAFIENDRVPQPPQALLNKSSLPKHPYSHDCRIGMIAPGLSDGGDRPCVFAQESRVYRAAGAHFARAAVLLYHAAQAVHLPSFPAKRYQGRSGAGPHGDFIEELDDVVGQLMSTLEKLGVAEKYLGDL